MPKLLETESRLPAILLDAEAGGSSFISKNAWLLGYNTLSGTFCLVSHLPSTVRGVVELGNFHNHYCMFVNDVVGTEYSYAWAVTYSFSDGSAAQTYSSTAEEGIAEFELDALEMGLDEANLSKLSKVEVSCTVQKSGGAASTLTLSHKIASVPTDIAALYAKDADTKTAKGGNEETTIVATNLMRGNFPTKPVWYTPQADAAVPAVETTWGEGGSAPALTHPLGILYARMMKARRKRWFPEYSRHIQDGINGGSLTRARSRKDNHVGPMAIALHVAAMLLGKTAFSRFDSRSDEEAAFAQFAALPTADKVDLFNLARFPKSAFTLGARMLELLLGKAKDNGYAQFLGSSSDKAAWIADQAAALKDTKFVRSLVFEYLNGPQADIGGVEYAFDLLHLNQLLKRAHKHPGSAYVQTILDYTVIATVCDIKDAYFARRKITVHAAGGYEVSWEKISSSTLGREEYVVVETDNADGRKLSVKLKLAEAGLGLGAGAYLELVPNAAGVTAFSTTVNLAANLLDEEENRFANADGHADKGLVVLGFRHPTAATFSNWNALLSASGAAKAKVQIEVGLDEADATVGVRFAGSDGDPDAADSTYTFLSGSGEALALGPVSKSAAPRIKDAYFARRVIKSTNAGALSVHFERIEGVQPYPQGGDAGTEPGNYSLGREVFVVVETVNMSAQDLKVFVRASDTTLWGAGGKYKPLPVAPLSAGTQPRFLTGSPIRQQPAGTWLNTLALKNNTGWVVNAADPYNPNNPNGAVPAFTNMASLENKVVLKFRIRPNTPIAPAAGQPATARALFDQWATNIGAGAAPLELYVKASQNDGGGSAQYVYYGAERDDEQASYDGGKRFGIDAGKLFTVQNRNVMEVYHSTNPYNINAFITGSTVNRRRIVKLLNNSSSRVTYFYHDALGNQHTVCTSVMTEVAGKADGKKFPTEVANPTNMVLAIIDYNLAHGIVDNVYNATHASWVAHVNANPADPTQVDNPNLVPLTIGNRNDAPAANPNITDYRDYQAEGVDAFLSYRFDTGVVTIGYTGYPDRYYANGEVYKSVDCDFLREVKVGATGQTVFLGLNYENTEGDQEADGVNGVGVVRLRLGFRETRRRHAEYNFFAAVLAGLGECNFDDINSAGLSFNDGTCFPSKTHTNGKAIDTDYLNTETRQNQIADAWWAMGIRTGSGSDGHLVADDGTWRANIHHSSPDDSGAHDDHMHTGGDEYETATYVDTQLP